VHGRREVGGNRRRRVHGKELGQYSEPCSADERDPQYLHSLPGTSNGYVISLDSNGSVNVAVGTAAATVFSDTSGCVGSF